MWRDREEVGIKSTESKFHLYSKHLIIKSINFMFLLRMPCKFNDISAASHLRRVGSNQESEPRYYIRKKKKHSILSSFSAFLKEKKLSMSKIL